MPLFEVSCGPEDREICLLVNFVRRTTSCVVNYELVQGNSPRLLIDSSVSAEGSQAVSRCLVSQCQQQANSRQAVCLLGEGSSEGAAVWQWCEFAQRFKSTPSKHVMLQQINDWLSTRSFVATGSLSLADLWLYAVCRPVLASNNFSFGGYQHLVRWFEQVHHTDGVRGAYPDLALYRV